MKPYDHGKKSTYPWTDQSIDVSTTTKRYAPSLKPFTPEILNQGNPTYPWNDQPVAVVSTDPKILIIVLTGGPTAQNRIPTIRNGWGNTSRLPANTVVRYFSDVLDPELPFIELLIGTPHTYGGNFERLFAALSVVLRDMTSQNTDTFDWIYKVDDDTTINIPNLVRLLSKEPVASKIMAGRCGVIESDHFLLRSDRRPLAGLVDHLSRVIPITDGGAGHILSYRLLVDLHQHRLLDLRFLRRILPGSMLGVNDAALGFAISVMELKDSAPKGSYVKCNNAVFQHEVGKSEIDMCIKHGCVALHYHPTEVIALMEKASPLRDYVQLEPFSFWRSAAGSDSVLSI